MIAAQLTGRERFGLAALLEEQFGVVLDKRYQRADWSRRPLGPELLAYAAADTATCTLAAASRPSPRWGIGAEEESAARHRARRAEAWLDVKGAGRLAPRQLARLQPCRDARRAGRVDVRLHGIESDAHRLGAAAGERRDLLRRPERSRAARTRQDRASGAGCRSRAGAGVRGRASRRIAQPVRTSRLAQPSPWRETAAPGRPQAARQRMTLEKLALKGRHGLLKTGREALGPSCSRWPSLTLLGNSRRSP
jgi:hypothetical protein